MKIKNILTVIALGVVMTGCSLDSLVKVKNPQIGAEVEEKYLESRTGALGVLNGAIGSLQKGVSNLSNAVSLFTDELTSVHYQGSLRYDPNQAGLDVRADITNWQGLRGIQMSGYSQIQTARIASSQAVNLLTRLADTSLNASIGHAHAIEGYATLLLAENLCSGIPLSSAVSTEKIEYGPALATDSVFRAAIASFTDALNIENISPQVHTLASIGLARSYQGLGDYKSAADAVAGMDPSNPYILHYTEAITPDLGGNSNEAADGFWTIPRIGGSGLYGASEVLNREGQNGLVWYADPSNVDPRVPVTTILTGVAPDTVRIFPQPVQQLKFVNGNVQLHLAKWAEAKLIEAEYLLSKSDPNWEQPLNEARRSIGLSDTTAGVTSMDKVNLLFRERAFWMYGEGKRLSDFRRLVRQYNRTVNNVYPTGPYRRSQTEYMYGDVVVFIPEIGENQNNYRYEGCINRNP